MSATIDQPTLDRKAWRFFYDHAGYIVGKRAECAAQLARAEQSARLRGFDFEWTPDNESGTLDDHEEWCGRAKWAEKAERYARSEDSPPEWAPAGWYHSFNRDACDHEVYGCVPMVDGEPDYDHALWGIIDPDRTYRRVIEAEVAAEVLAEEAEHIGLGNVALAEDR